MGCGASRVADPSLTGNPNYIEVTSAWDRAWSTAGVKKGTKIKTKGVVVKRTGWKTIRIFVSSTFRDFHQEREVLVKKVFPDLRLWCETHRLRLIECDLRWGVPKDDNTEGTLRACLGEIDRCYHDNIMPFFINMTSERIGWIPKKDEVPDVITSEYKWVDGLSVTEMEIFHAAYRIDNPNALFMLRDPSFIDGVPEEYKERFIENQSITPIKLDILRKMIRERFPAQRIHNYEVDYLGYNPDTKIVELGGLEKFADIVYNFFKERISAQYPLPDDSHHDPYQHAKEQHESFMNNRSEYVFGRDAILNELDSYITSPKTDVPLIIIGNAGTGKSSITARIAEQVSAKALTGQLKISGKKETLVFYHFVGAVPGSTDLEKALKRLLIELGTCTMATMPKDLESTSQLVRGTLSNPNTKPTVVIIDALNQFDTDAAAVTVTWVPRKMAPQVRCIFSMIQNTPQHLAFMKREPAPQVLDVSPLDHETRQVIVTEMLGRYNKRLDEEQMDNLLSKGSSSNPLWLSIAVEELRVFGMFRKILDKINQLADGLLELEIQIIERFERESNRNLLMSTLCLMEVSGHGLLETELLAVLAHEDDLLMPEEDEKDAGNEKSEKEQSEKKDKRKLTFLPAQKWAEVYRNLKPFLRPFGDSGEGRLDFYHRSLSKAVRRKYFYDEEGNERKEVYKWWHGKLAAFFEKTNDLRRQIEEYPVHLLALGDNERLKIFLTRWDVFHALFDEDFSSRLINIWRISCGFDEMENAYQTALMNFCNLPDKTQDEKNAHSTLMAKFFIQSGRLKSADALLQKVVEEEKNELGNRPDHMVELYQTIAANKDEIQKMEGYYEDGQVPIIREILDYFSKSIELRRSFSGEHHQRKLAAALNRMAFYFAELTEAHKVSHESINLPDEERATSLQERALVNIEEAIAIYKDLNDEAMVADCMITRGVVYGRGSMEQLKTYKDAVDVLLNTVGEYNHSMARAHLNIGVYYEDCRQYKEAFESFCKWHLVLVELYGAEHTKTLRSIQTLNEPFYARYCRVKGVSIPPTCILETDQDTSAK